MGEKVVDQRHLPWRRTKLASGAASYARWLHQNAVRFVAAPDANLDYSAKAEMALIDRGLPYLHLVTRSRHWRVYQVADATPIVQGPATLRTLGPDSLTIAAHRAGTLVVHVRFTPYWALSGGSGCVAPDGQYTRVTLRAPGTVRLVTQLCARPGSGQSRRDATEPRRSRR